MTRVRRSQQEATTSKNGYSRPLASAALSDEADYGDLKCPTYGVIQVLFEYGADPLIPVDGNTTIIHHCVSHREMAQTLSKVPGLDLEHRDGTGKTMLLAAFTRGDSDQLIDIRPTSSRITLVHRLCGMGADLSVADGEGNTAAHLLIHLHKPYERERMTDIILFIVEKRPSLLRQKNNEGLTPVHLAIQNQQTDLIRRFLELGTDAMGPDPEGKKVVGLFKYLMGVGLDPSLEDKRQQTVIDVAAAYGNKDTLKLFQKE
ncbi:ankyrin repeat-containing domain protein [Aspergillus heterothallicus]